MKSLKPLLALFCMQAFLAALWIVLTPSESGRAVFLWLSRERILLLGLGILIWIVTLAAGLTSWLSPASLESMQVRIDRFCLGQKRLVSVLVYLLVFPALLFVASLTVAFTPLEYNTYRTWAPDTFPLLHSLVGAIFPLLLLAVFIALEFGLFLMLHYRRVVGNRELWAWHQIGAPVIALLATLLTLFYWVVLAFQLRFFVNNPAWYWKFDPVALNWGDLAFALIALLLLSLVYWALLLRRRVLIGLLLLFVLGWFLQLSVGLMSGRGFAAFLDRYFSTYHKTYISKAVQGRVSILDEIRQYEDLFGARAFTNTKPPGLMAFYIGLDHLLNGHPPAYAEGMRYQRLSTVIADVFPALAMLLLFAIYAFARRYVHGRLDVVPALAPFLLVLCPNLILFSLFPDQAIYPLLFLLGATFIIVTVQRQSVILAFVLGLALYFAVFFAFTMLPLYPFALIFLTLSYWVHRRDLSLQRQIGMVLALAAGTLLLYFLFRLFLNYDFLPRFEKTVTINHNFDFYLRVKHPIPMAPESLSTRIGQILGAAWLNNLDFAAGMGFPLYIVFLVGSFRLLGRLFKGAYEPGDIILAALLLSFIVLILAGTAQGEVPRLWLFWLPMMVMLAALELEPYAVDRPLLLFGLAIVQLITLFLTFHFQDLRM